MLWIFHAYKSEHIAAAGLRNQRTEHSVGTGKLNSSVLKFSLTIWRWRGADKCVAIGKDAEVKMRRNSLE